MFSRGNPCGTALMASSTEPPSLNCTSGLFFGLFESTLAGWSPSDLRSLSSDRLVSDDPSSSSEVELASDGSSSQLCWLLVGFWLPPQPTQRARAATVTVESMRRVMGKTIRPSPGGGQRGCAAVRGD